MLKNHAKLIIILSAIVLGMFAFGFALVPIYNSLCKNLGLNGKINPDVEAFDSKNTVPLRSRDIVVEFVANKNSTLDWEFFPRVARITIHPGKISKLAFYAENKSNERMSVQAVPSVTPAIAAKYIKKTECFCFTRQTLNGHEAMDMPLLFHLDKELPENIKTITLSYTLYDVTERAK